MVKIGAAIVLVITTLQCSAQDLKNQDLIPRDVLFDLSDRKEWIRISPDASRVFYIKGAFQQVPDNHLYYRNIRKTDEEFSIKFDGSVTDYNLLDNHTLIVRTQNSKGQSIIKYDIRTEKYERLQEPYFNALVWLAFSQNRENVAFLAMPKNGDPFLAKLNIPLKQIDTLKNVAQGHFPIFFDRDLNVIAGEKIDQKTMEKRLDFWRDGKWHSFKKYEWSAERFLRPGLKSILSVNSNGSKIYFTDNSTSDKTELLEFDLTTEQSKTLIKEQNSDLIVRPSFTSSQNKPLAIANHYSKREWNIVDEKVRSDFEFLNSRMEDYHILDATENLNYWIVEELNGGLNICYLYDRKNRSLERMFSDHDALEKYTKVNRYYDNVSSFDSLKLPIQYYLSEKFDKDKNGIPDKEMPAVIYVHGGPWQGWMEDNWLINRHLQLLADRGYLVVYAQFRGALTYGKNFLNAGDNQWGDGMVKDNVAIANWLVVNRKTAKDKIGIFGWSYGGYAALAGAAFSPETYACAISLYGPTYLDAPQEEFGFVYSPNSLIRIADLRTEKGLELAKLHSPLYYADKMNIPILMSTGSKDERVSQMQMDKMADALHQNQKDVTYFIYPNEGHDYILKESWTTFWSITEAFLSEHLGGDAESYKDEDYSILKMKYQSVNKQK